MADENLGNVYQLICQIFNRQRESPLTDAQLLERFVASRDAAAFELLVRRHCRTVLNTCRRVLDQHEAEDAMQATFLTLILKADSIARRHSVAGWLRKVARRSALKAKAKTASQASREKQRAVPETVDDPTPACIWQEVRSTFDEEIERLPRRYRLPFVLCHIEGKTNAEAGRELGCSTSTVATRLAWARQRLAKQLNRRGVTLPAALGAAVDWDQITAAATVPARVISSTVRAGLAYATGDVHAGVVSASAVTLAEGVVQTMIMTKIGVALGFVFSVGLLVGAGFGFSRKWAAPARVATIKQVSASAATRAAEKKLAERQVVPAAAFEVGCHDGRKLKLKLKDRQVRLITPEGKQLLFHRDKIRRIEFAYATRRVSEDIRRQMDAAVADLGSQEYQRRAKAFAELRRLGGRASAALLKASKNQDLEVRLRAKALLTNLCDQALDNGLALDEATFAELCQYDILYTVDAKFVGRIDAESLTLCTDRTKEVQLKVADLDFLQSLSVDLAVEFVEKLGGRVSRAEKADDRPVIAIDFSNRRRANSKNLKELRQLATPLATLQTLNLRDCPQITDAGLKALTDFKELQSLNLWCCDNKITDAGLKALTELKDLRELNLRCCQQITDAGLKELKKLKELRKLDLSCCEQITGVGLKELTELKELRELELMGCLQITDAGLKELKELKELRKLILNSCEPITDGGLKELKEFKGLRELDIGNCKQITDAGLKELKELKGLRKLVLWSCKQITDAGLKELKELRNLNLIGCEQITGAGLKELKELRKLDLSGCPQITGVDLKELKELKELRKLDLRNCQQITDAGLKELKELKGLRELDLGNCKQITDAGLKELKELKELRKLDLWSCKQITGVGLKELKNLKELRELNLNGCELITDAGLKELKNLKELQKLVLWSCQQITDAGLKELKNLKELRLLNLMGCQQITDAGLKELKNLKGLQTLYLNGCNRITYASLKEFKELRELSLEGCQQITDAGLKGLKDLKGLQRLRLKGCRQITNAAVADLQKNLPNLWIGGR